MKITQFAKVSIVALLAFLAWPEKGDALAQQVDVIDVTLVTDTSAYADNDVLAVPQAVVGFFRVPGGVTKIKSVRVLDEADQGVDLDLIFLNATGTLGTINDAFNPTDAVAQTILGTVSVVAADYDDYVNSKVADKEVDVTIKGADTARSVWVAAAVRSGTPTFAADSLKLKIAVERF